MDGSLDCGGWKASTLERGVPSGSLGDHVIKNPPLKKKMFLTSEVGELCVVKRLRYSGEHRHYKVHYKTKL